MKYWLLVLALVFHPYKVSAMDVTPFLPMSIEQILDASTLDEKVVHKEVLTHPDFPGEEVEKLTTRYFSHQWKDGPWHGTVNIYLPKDIPEVNRGLVALCPRGSLARTIMPDIDIERDYPVGTALHFKIPVCTMPQAGEHFNLKEIHQL